MPDLKQRLRWPVFWLVGVLMACMGIGWGLRGRPAAPPPAERLEAAAAPAPPPARREIRMHTVADGENLQRIAQRYGIDVDTVLGANPQATELIHPGEQLVILPEKGVLHTVTQGDTCWRLARLYQTKTEDILKANHKTTADLTVGEKLFIPGARLPQRLKNGGVPVSRAVSKRFYWPARGEITSPFGRRWGRTHHGMDIANDLGTPVRASQAGRVSYAGWRGGYGKAVIVDHRGGYQTLYGHLSSISVAAGETVRAGQTVGSMGSTGNSTGPHVHFEIRRNGAAVNPRPYLP